MSFQRLCRGKIVRHGLSLRDARRHSYVYPRSCSPSLLLRYSQTPLCVGIVYRLVNDRFRLFTTVVNDEYEQYRHPSRDVLKLIQQENNRTQQCIPQNLRAEIAQEILQAYDSAIESIPEMGPTGQYLYFSEDIANGQRRYRRRHVQSNEEQHVLDISFHENHLLAMSLSVNETLVAYLVSPVTSPSQTLVKIRTLNSKWKNEIVLPTADLHIANVEWGPLQTDGSNSLFLTATNSRGHPCAVYACCVDSTGGQITPLQSIYSNDDDNAVIVDVQRTKGCRYVALYASTKTSSEVRLVANVDSSPILVRPRQEGVLYHLDVGDEDNVFLLAHAAEPDHESGLSEEMALFEADVSSLPLGSSFGTRLSKNEDGETVIADMDVFRTFVALYERSTVDGRHQIRIRKRQKGDDTLVPLPLGSGECAVLSSSGNMHFGSTCLQFHVESPCSPGRSYSYDTVCGTVNTLGANREPVRLYTEKRVFVTSKDGSQVPMSIIYAEAADDESRRDNLRPTVLIGYGAYGEAVVQAFDPTIIPLLRRGFVVAYAHTRGGGELGRAWYRAGRLHGKKRAIEDYIACAEALVDKLDITEPRLLTGKAFSAGGVIVASAVNQRPDLFGSVVLTNAFLDVTTAMTTNTDKLTEHECSEWGNVLRDNEGAAAVSSYCPLTNVSPQDYPPILLVGAMDDTNVPYWHPLTFCLKIRKALEGRNVDKDGNQEEGGSDRRQRVLLYVEESGGHQLHGTKLGVASMEAAFMFDLCQDNAD